MKPTRKATLTNIPLPPRRSRHGRIMVGDAPKDLDDQRPSPFVKHWRTVETNKVTGELEIKHHKRPMTLEEVQATRQAVRRASESTIEYGKPNRTSEGHK